MFQQRPHIGETVLGQQNFRFEELEPGGPRGFAQISAGLDAEFGALQRQDEFPLTPRLLCIAVRGIGREGT
jgi:hypothetical protein